MISRVSVFLNHGTTAVLKSWTIFSREEKTIRQIIADSSATQKTMVEVCGCKESFMPGSLLLPSFFPSVVLADLYRHSYGDRFTG